MLTYFGRCGACRAELRVFDHSLGTPARGTARADTGGRLRDGVRSPTARSDARAATPPGGSPTGSRCVLMADAGDGARSAPSADVLDKLRRTRRGVAILVVFIALVCVEHWIRGDRWFPFWAYLLLGGSCVCMLASFTYLMRAIERKRQASGVGPGFRKRCKSARFRHTFGCGSGTVRTYVRHIGWDGRSGAGACVARRAGVSCVRSASSRRGSSSEMEIVRAADDDGDWQAAGCSSSAQWLAQVSSSDYRTAAQITRTSERAAQPAGARSSDARGHADARSGRSRGAHTRRPRPTPSWRASRSARRRVRSHSQRARSPRLSSPTMRRSSSGAR